MQSSCKLEFAVVFSSENELGRHLLLAAGNFKAKGLASHKAHMRFYEGEGGDLRENYQIGAVTSLYMGKD